MPRITVELENEAEVVSAEQVELFPTCWTSLNDRIGRVDGREVNLSGLLDLLRYDNNPLPRVYDDFEGKTVDVTDVWYSGLGLSEGATFAEAARRVRDLLSRIATA